MGTRLFAPIATGLLIAAGLFWSPATEPESRAAEGKAGVAPKPAEPAAAPGGVVESFVGAGTPLALPDVRDLYRPVRFKSDDGRAGWVVRVSNDALPTPAFADGRLYVGGGFGSRDFQAFNAKTGALVWKRGLEDPGASAAVVENGKVAFITESCTLYVADARNGNGLWHQWLGSYTLSQPAVAGDRIYSVFPASGKRDLVVAGAGSRNLADPKLTGYRLLCSELATGRDVWERPVTQEAVSAPVVDKDRVYLTCFDGTAFCMDAKKGELVWKKELGVIAAPLVVNGRVLLSTSKRRAAHDPDGAEGDPASYDRYGRTAVPADAAGPADQGMPAAEAPAEAAAAITASARDLGGTAAGIG